MMPTAKQISQLSPETIAEFIMDAYTSRVGWIKGGHWLRGYNLALAWAREAKGHLSAGG